MFPSGVLASTEMHHIRATPPVIPVADLGQDSPLPKETAKLRNQLASLYRLVDNLHWSQSIYNHMTVRLPTEKGRDEILINPFGLFYREVTAANLITVDLKGNVIDQGNTKHSINQAGFVLHSAIHDARRDICAVLHLHTPSVAAVASMECGLLPICQEAMIIGPVAYHDYQGILVDESERVSLVEDLGDKNVLILRNHGFVVCGKTIEEAFHYMYHLILSCETQIRAMSCGGVDKLIIPTKEAAERAYNTARNGGGGVNREKEANKVVNTRWGVGELEWQAWMRVLDDLGTNTGYPYRQL